DGTNYIGRLSTTESGRVCQPWRNLAPHNHTQNGAMFPEGNLTIAENYCRNPEGNKFLWCYTMDPDRRWEACEAESC
ncbi:hypothetical protein CAPTEDRAFT_49103, partial [Capitella teleta]